MKAPIPAPIIRYQNTPLNVETASARRVQQADVGEVPQAFGGLVEFGMTQINSDNLTVFPDALGENLAQWPVPAGDIHNRHARLGIDERTESFVTRQAARCSRDADALRG